LLFLFIWHMPSLANGNRFPTYGREVSTEPNICEVQCWIGQACLRTNFARNSWVRWNYYLIVFRYYGYFFFHYFLFFEQIRS